MANEDIEKETCETSPLTNHAMTYTCPKCGHSFQARAGKRVLCYKCETSWKNGSISYNGIILGIIGTILAMWFIGAYGIIGILLFWFWVLFWPRKKR
jgi:hypothetical protein